MALPNLAPSPVLLIRWAGSPAVWREELLLLRLIN